MGSRRRKTKDEGRRTKVAQSSFVLRPSSFRKAVYHLLNVLCLGCYGAGLSAVSTFITNTRVIGVRDSAVKPFLIVCTVVALPLVSLLNALRVGGLGSFLPSLLHPFSWIWMWRTYFTLLGARYISQEIYKYMHPRAKPAEVTPGEARVIDMRDDIARVEGVSLHGPKGLVYRLNELYCLEIAAHEVVLDTLPPQFDGFTLVQVSDVHYGDFISAEFVRRYVEEIIGLSPDLIALTGDYQQYSKDVTRATQLLASIGAWSRKERAGLGAVAVLGNHDTWSGTADVTEALQDAGIKVLNNKHIKLKRNGASLYIAGVADPWSLRADLSRTLLDVPDEACVILLAHVPDYIVESSKFGIALQLSGHLHAGQIKLPFIGALLSPSRFNRRYIEGFYKKGHTLMYVSRGLGGHPPIRYDCKPEIAVLVLRSTKPPGDL